jgi:DNA-binding CsgD family transcriptional regulator
VTSKNVPPHELEALFVEPLERLHRILERGERHLELRRAELAEVRYALYELSAHPTATTTRGQVVLETLPAELAPPVLRHLVDTTTTITRSCTLSIAVGSGTDADTIRHTQERIRSGAFRQQAIYPMDILDSDSGRTWVRSWADAGEEQRVSLVPPSEFAVFDDQAVLAVADWADPAADYVLIRDPMVIAAFTALFDRSFVRALPIAPDAPAGDDAELVRLLGLGLKDETIARYLGCSLRTIRRRLAQLMDRYGVQTRFQLGVAAARAGLVTLDHPTDR